jgi:8-oxo-dGTP pyrophosphatase MutT (NUDIX family)
MGKRRDVGRWTLPGGHVDPGESLEACAVREVFEEAGLVIPAVKHLGSEDVITHTGKEYTIHAYQADYSGGVPSPRFDPDMEVDKWLFIDYSNGLPSEILNNLHSPKNVVLNKLGLLPKVPLTDILESRLPIRSVLTELITWDGRYMHLGKGQVSSMPTLHSNTAVVFDHSKDGALKVFQKGGGKVMVNAEGWDKEFVNIRAFIDWANKEKLQYVGIDDIEN